MNSFIGNILKATAKLITTYRDALDDQQFIEKLGAISVKQLMRTAKERRPGAMGFAEAMVLEYNGRKKIGSSRLLINKLYVKETSIEGALADIDEPYEVKDDPRDFAETDLSEEDASLIAAATPVSVDDVS